MPISRMRAVCGAKKRILARLTIFAPAAPEGQGTIAQARGQQWCLANRAMPL